MDGKHSSDNKSDSKVIYQISLTSKTLGAINPYLFIEQLKDKILSKLPSVKVSVIYNTKGQAKEHPLVKLKCFSSKSLPIYQINNLREEISFLAFNLEHELNHRIEDNRQSVA
jgi:hypothetical protein